MNQLLKNISQAFSLSRVGFPIITILLLIQINIAQVAQPKLYERGTLDIRITGFPNDDGECWFALDNAEAVYESEDSVFIGKILPIISGEVIINIDSLDYGNYAIRVFHDENSNGELDSNFLGIPTEDYGFSNNVSAWFGAPSWERAKFLFNQKQMTIKISVD